MPTEIQGQEIGSTGFGLMGLTTRSPLPSDEAAFAAMRTAISTGCTFWNAGEFYGSPTHNSLTLLNSYFTRYPDDAKKIVLNVKGAVRPGPLPDGSPAFVRESVDNCLRMLDGKAKIDMFECARRDPNVPLKDTLEALAAMVKEGKIGGVALSEVSAATIREAAEITKIVAVEVELSLWERGVLTNGIAEACAELDIPIIAYSPLGRGMLTGAFKSFSDIPPTDRRHMSPRFYPENFSTNIKLVEELSQIAKSKNCTASQLALSWVRNLSKRDGLPEIIPIPGATTTERVLENAVEVPLSEEELAGIDAILAGCKVAGDRYPAQLMKYVDG